MLFGSVIAALQELLPPGRANYDNSEKSALIEAN
jgi:hypothetical protein